MYWRTVKRAEVIWMGAKCRNKRCSAKGRTKWYVKISKERMGIIEFWKGRSDQKNTEKLSGGYRSKVRKGRSCMTGRKVQKYCKRCSVNGRNSRTKCYVKSADGIIWALEGQKRTAEYRKAKWRKVKRAEIISMGAKCINTCKRCSANGRNSKMKCYVKMSKERMGLIELRKGGREQRNTEKLSGSYWRKVKRAEVMWSGSNVKI